MGRAPSLPMTETARAQVMGWTAPGEGEGSGRTRARKFVPHMDAPPGSVPGQGTPSSFPSAQGEGSILPVVAASRSIPDTADLWAELLEEGRILAPPYEPWLLVCAVDESDTLPQAIEAMATNIGGHGYELEATFATRDPTTGSEIKPPPEAVQEREDLELWLAGLNVSLGLPGLMELVDRDTETIGYGVAEVLRDSTGRVAALEHIPAYTIRLGPEDRPILVDHVIRHPTTGQLVTVRRHRRFRLFAQIKEGRTVWFKAYGDPRHVNWKTGEIRATAWGEDGRGNSLEATELVYQRRYHPATPYGVPLWIGATPHVRAARSAAELVVDWFDHAPIGVKLAMVAGGKWKDGAIDALQDQLDSGARGMENAWKVMGLEAEQDDAGGHTRDMLEETRDAPPRMGFEDLSTEIPDGIYKGRDSLIGQAPSRIRAMFRLGAIYYGDSEGESNRAAADTARAIGEEQVFAPLRRQRWENLFNGQILPSMKINCWRIKLQGATTSDDTEGVAKALAPLVAGGGASPNALAKLYSSMTGQAVQLISEPWGDRPMALTLQLLAADLDPNKPLADLAAEAATRAEEAKAAAADALAAASGAPGKGPPGKAPEGPPAKARKGLEGEGGAALALGAAQAFLDLRQTLIAELEAEGAGAVAKALEDLPRRWTERG